MSRTRRRKPSQVALRNGAHFFHIINQAPLPGFGLRRLTALDNDPDISLYWQHDSSQPLATTLSGSLNMRTDEEGLIFDALLADTTLGRDAMELLHRGMVRQMSFGFTVREDKFDGDLRTLLDVDLAEISLVERAAYPQTNADARALSRSHSFITQRNALRIKNWRKT